MLLLLAMESWAGSLRSETKADQARRSDVVMEGYVRDITYDLRTLDGEEVAVTYYDLSVESVLLGEVRAEVVRVVLPGGPLRDGKTWAIVPGTPELQLEELVLVHGIQTAPGEMMLTGFSEGVVRAVTTEDGSLLASDSKQAPIAWWGCESEGHPITQVEWRLDPALPCFSGTDYSVGSAFVGQLGVNTPCATGPDSFTIPSGIPAGFYYLCVKVDPDDIRGETSEGDNIVRSEDLFNISPTCAPGCSP